MSFRYTNNLISTIKQRALLREYQRELFHRVFTGACSGILVQCNASGEVLGITHDASAEGRYREEGSSTGGALDGVAVAKAVKLAVWEAMRKVHATKDDLYHRSIKVSELMDPRGLGGDLSGDNTKSAQGLGATSSGAFQNSNMSYNPVWFAENSTSIGPFVYDSVHDRVVGGGTSDWFYGESSSAVSSSSSSSAFRPTLAHIFPESAAHLLLLNEEEEVVATSSSSSPGEGAAATSTPTTRQAMSTSATAVQEAAAVEMCDDEANFWRRVEGIRRAQQTVLGSTPKRGYLDDPNNRQPVSDYEERVSLRFIS